MLFCPLCAKFSFKDVTDIDTLNLNLEEMGETDGDLGEADGDIHE